MVILFLLIIIFVLIAVKPKSRHEQHIITLVRQAARWSIAAKQDESPMIAVLHANYGTGYLWALKDIASETEIKRATGIDIKKFESEIVRVQDNATIEMIRVCPEFGPRTFVSNVPCWRREIKLQMRDVFQT